MNMSFMLTTEAMYNFDKTVTRRDRWRKAQVGQILTAVEKSQGLKAGEKVQPIHEIQIISTTWEPLNRMILEPEYGEKEVALEGFPNLTPKQFVEMYCDHNKGKPTDPVNRIEFRFLIRKQVFTVKIGGVPLAFFPDNFEYQRDGTLAGMCENLPYASKVLMSKFRFDF